MSICENAKFSLCSEETQDASHAHAPADLWGWPSCQLHGPSATEQPPSSPHYCISRHTTKYRGNRICSRAIFIPILWVLVFRWWSRGVGMLWLLDLGQSWCKTSWYKLNCLLAPMRRRNRRHLYSSFSGNRKNIQTIFSRFLSWLAVQSTLDNPWPDLLTLSTTAGELSPFSVQQPFRLCEHHLWCFKGPSLCSDPANTREGWALLLCEQICAEMTGELGTGLESGRCLWSSPAHITLKTISVNYNIYSVEWSVVFVISQQLGHQHLSNKN